MHFTLHSRLVHSDLHEILVVPRRHGDWMLVLLHGYHASPSQFLTQPFFDTLTTLGTRAPEVLLLDGGADSYWHDRADGRVGLDGPARGDSGRVARTHAQRVAIGGISMGGYGALLLGSRDHGASARSARQSPALWLEREPKRAPGAFDDAAGLRAAHDVFNHPSAASAPLDRPRQRAIPSAARRSHLRARRSTPRCTSGRAATTPRYWHAFTPQFLRFYRP